MENTILIFVEKRTRKIQNVSFELLSEVKRQLKDTNYPVKALYLTDKATKKDLTELTKSGADEILLLEDERFKEYDTYYFTETIANLFKKEGRPSIFLIGSTLIGRDLAPRLSAKIRTGLTADATILGFEESDEKLILQSTRPALGGNIFATILCKDHTPQMATIRPGIFLREKFKDQKENVRNITPEIKGESKVKVLKTKKLKKSGENLQKANLIFAGGRGVEKSLKVLENLAKETKGCVAVSRALVDSGCAKKERQVGQTGQTVRPNIYIASGISGAIQHTAGMENSEIIIAINQDPKAPIFSISDVSIISDANKVLPLLLKELKRIKK